MKCNVIRTMIFAQQLRKYLYLYVIWRKSTKYNLKNYILKEMSMNLINIFKHKIYSFQIYL